MRMSERGTLNELEKYSVDDYLADVAAAEHLTPAYRGAMITAAKKRLKSSITVERLSLMAVEHDLDMTPTMAQNIVKSWLGRCAGRPAIAAKFGLPGRSAADKSADHGQTAELAAMYRDRVLGDINAAFAKAAERTA